MISALKALFDLLSTALLAIFNAVWNIVSFLAQSIAGGVLEGLYFLINVVLTGVYETINLLDFSLFITSYALDWSGVPPSVIYLVTQTGLPQGLTIIATAMLFRLILNIIPAALTRV